MINFIKNHYKNIQFYLRIVLVSFLPIVTALGLQPEGFTTWESVGTAIIQFVSNPFLLVLYIVTLSQSFASSKNKIEDMKVEGE